MSDSDFECSVFYTDIDSIFDTRMAVLHGFGTEVLEKVLGGGYFSRVHDEFTGVDMGAFKIAYDARNEETLKQALATPVVDLIRIFIKQTMAALVQSPYRRQPKVMLNTYPYLLSEKMEKSIIVGLVSALQNMADIQLVNIPPSALTPKYVKDNIVQMAMYSYNTWLDFHSENRNFVDTQCPAVALYAPGLLRNKDCLKEIRGQDIFTALETYASIFIKLKVVPARVFSVDYGRMVKKT